MPKSLLTALPEKIFQLIFEKSPGSLLVSANEPLFTIVAISDNYLDIASASGKNLIGMGFFEAFPIGGQTIGTDKNSPNLFTSVLQTREKIDIPNYRYDVHNNETHVTETRYWSGCNTPIFDASDKVAYILNTVVDVTAEVLARQAAEESEKRLRLATEATSLATWDLNLTDQTFIYSPRLAEIFGHPANTAITLAGIRAQVDSKDMQEIVVKAYHTSLLTGDYIYEVRIYWPDGSVHWIKTQGVVLYDKIKQPVRMLGTILDITDSKKDEIRKNEFIAIASHELKTPLTSLKAYLQILGKKIPTSNDDLIKSLVVKANNQVNRMTDLINGLLNLSKIEPGHLQFKMQPFELGKLVVNAIAETRLGNNEYNFYFEPCEKITVNADKEKIEQVINNFLRNAIKFSPKGSRIMVKCINEYGFVKVSVTDEGIGIKPKDQAKLFQRFYRVENEKMKNISGFGIGLYLSGEIIARHNGKIWVESTEGGGSTFYFTLPLPE